MNILLTGFEPFGSVQVNPSQVIVEHIASTHAPNQVGIMTAVLPVDYKLADEQLQQIITEYQPDAVLMLGVAQRYDAINLERIAVNIDDARLGDNGGYQASGQPIDTEGPVGYWSTLPLAVMHRQLEAAHIPVRYSNHAGAYLCNHVFYRARHLLHKSGRDVVPCGFIHLPAIGVEPPNMPLETMITAVKLCLDALLVAQWDAVVTQPPTPRQSDAAS